MKLWNVSLEQLQEALNQANRDYAGNLTFKSIFPNGKHINFTLTVHSSRSPGARRGFRGQRIAAACWHAHRDVMHEIFDGVPDARLKSGMIDYRGRDDFESNHHGTGYRNIGSQLEPLSYQQACDCEG